MMIVRSTRQDSLSSADVLPQLAPPDAAARTSAGQPLAFVQARHDGVEAKLDKPPFPPQPGGPSDTGAEVPGKLLWAGGSIDLKALLEAIARNDLTTDPNVTSLPADVQQRLRDLANGRPELAESYKRLAANPQFRALTAEQQVEAAELVAKSSASDRANVESLISSPVFAALDAGAKTNLLAGLSNTQEARDLLTQLINSGGLSDASAEKIGALGNLAATVAPVVTGFGKAVDDVVNASLKLTMDFRKADTDNNFRVGTPSEQGSWYDPSKREIVIDRNITNPAVIAQVLAHEVAHALQSPITPPRIDRETTQWEFVNEYVWKKVRNEAEACLESMVARTQILQNSGTDIGINGTQTLAYDRIYRQFAAGLITRDQAIDQIARIWGTQERPSNKPHLTYNEYYTPEAVAYYNWHKPTLGPGQHPW